MDSDQEDVEASALALATQLAREAIELVRRERTVLVRTGDALDVVTTADIAIETHFRQRISKLFPVHAIHGEEQGLDAQDRDWTWVVDPIDGTFNYATGFPGSASSIAVMHGLETRIGVIADFSLDTVFSCRKGAGMTCDRGRGSLPAAAETSELGRARLLIDPGHQAPDPLFFRALQSLAELAPVVPRLIGSAAVSLAAVALCGGCFVGVGLEIWDAAAGMLLAEEQGRAVKWWRFAGDSSHHVLAGEPEVVQAFEPVMPELICAWRTRVETRAGKTIEAELLGPSATLLV